MEPVFRAIYVYHHKQLFYIPEHKHRFPEIVYYEQGTGTTCIGGVRYSYEPGMFSVTQAHLPMDEQHDTLSTPWCLQLEPGDGIFLQNGVYHDTQDKRIFQLFTKIVAERQMKLPHGDTMLDFLCGQLWVEAARVQEAGDELQERFHQVLQTIELNYCYEIDLNSLAVLTNYSYEHFRHLFKKWYGVSPKQYIINRRIEHAKELLRKSNYTAAYISQLCGFPNYNQFVKQFRAACGMTPGAYQQRF